MLKPWVGQIAYLFGLSTESQGFRTVGPWQESWGRQYAAMQKIMAAAIEQERGSVG